MHARTSGVCLITLTLIMSASSLHLVQAETEWKSCGQGTFTLENAVLTPDVITPGTTARFTISAKTSEAVVDGGNIFMLVKLAGLPIYTQQDNLCSKTTCPLKQNSDAKIIYEQDFPVYTPPGTYSVLLSSKSSSGTDLFCVEITFSVAPIPRKGDFISNTLYRSKGLWKRKLLFLS